MKRIYLLAATLALAGCSLLNSPPATAGTVVITWENPTTNTDNSPIPTNQADPEALQSWRIEYGTCAAGNTFGTRLGDFPRVRAANGPPITSATQNLPGGLKCFRVYVKNSANESDASNVSARDIPLATPRAPANAAAILAGS